MTFTEQRQQALAILIHGKGLNRRSASFLGQCSVDDAPLTDKQQAWFDLLVRRFNETNEGVATDVWHVS